MKKVLKILLSAVLVVSFAFGAVACVRPNDSGTTKTGLSYKKVNGVYEIYKYTAEDDVDTLTIEIKGVSEGVKIRKNTFAGNSSLKTIIVTSSVAEIEKGAFAEMNSLEQLVVPFIGRYEYADVKFKETGSATQEDKKAVDLERTIAHFFGDEEYGNGVSQTINFGAKTDICYMPTTLRKVIVNAESTYSIPWCAFNGANQLETISLLGDIDAIGEGAFANTAITSIEIPASVKTIHKDAFNASLVKNVVFKDGAKVDLFDSVFFGCKLLSFVGNGEIAENTIDLGLFNTIGEKAFDAQNGATESLAKTYTVVNAGEFDIDSIFGKTNVK